MTLTEFLLARIAEDETAARAIQGDEGTNLAGVWHFHHADYEGEWPVPGAEVTCTSDTGHYDIPQWARWAERHNPARVLAECEAKRRIVADLADIEDGPYLLGLLAIPYADHPDFNPAWRP